MKNKKTIILLLLIAIVGVVGLTLAYFANTANVLNEFKTNQYGTTVTEVFESPDNWTPGTDTSKTLTVTNSGQVDEAVRVSYTESWTSKKGDNLSLTQGNNRAAIINFSDNGDWTPVTESDNKTYYYYNYKLAPNETTSTLLNSVTFNSAITNSSNCVTEETATGKTVTCASTGNGYDGATYKLVFKVETVQYDKYGEAWETDINILEEKPIIVFGLNVNPKSKTYATGNKQEMFVFEHEKTEQTDALTDYRYIGDSPNNYVYFNCNSINNQSASTCEVWGIIGVFEVDDGTGKYEQRIKLIGNAMSYPAIISYPRNTWGSGNNWNQYYLNLYLNGDYYNSLKNTSKDMIENAKYYLGGNNQWDSIKNMDLLRICIIGNEVKMFIMVILLNGLEKFLSCILAMNF